MNPLTNVKNTQKLNQRELELGLIGKKSWHDQYKDSAWIFVGGLPYDLTEGDIICVFSQYGEIVNINLTRDKKTGKSLGYAFVCYEDQRSTVLAVDNLNGIKILNRTIRVDHAANYRPPKETGDEDEIVKELRAEGCAPQVPESSSSEEGEVKDSPPSPPKKLKKEKLEKKMKRRKPKKRKKKKDSRKGGSSSSSSSSSSDSDSSSPGRRGSTDTDLPSRLKEEPSTYDKYSQHVPSSRRPTNSSSSSSTLDLAGSKRKYNDISEKYEAKLRQPVLPSSYPEPSNRVRSVEERFDARREYSRNNTNRPGTARGARFAEGGRRSPYTDRPRSPPRGKAEYRDYDQPAFREDLRDPNRGSRFPAREENYRGRENAYIRRETGYHAREGAYVSRDGGTGYPPRENLYPPREGTGLLRDPIYPPRDPSYAQREPAYSQRDTGYPPRGGGYLPRDDSHTSRNHRHLREEEYVQRDTRYQQRDSGYTQRETPAYRQREPPYTERDRTYTQRERTYPERNRGYPDKNRTFSEGANLERTRGGAEDYRRERTFRASDENRDRNYNRKPDFERERRRNDRNYDRRER
ncbi:RBMX2 [Acanthosepion pharaonis]|uniref:RNA-binding motif protein, X-linked 2 n=1 Tax=Acanthosepion pharaonis TaxID=158019 RepID=A0A812DJ29_ACAPH|nr:RBMX2 [Sepia pharaonis]